MRKIIVYLLLIVLLAQLAPVTSITAEGKSNIYIFIS